MALTEIPSELSSTPSIVDNGNATAITIGSDESATFAGSVSISHGAGDSLTLTKTTTEPSLRLEGDTNKDFVITVSGELLTITQNDGSTGLLTLDHDTKGATFAGAISVAGNLRSASFSVGAADSGEALNILDGGHTGHGATNTVSLASFGENVSGNSSGVWLGSMTNETTAVIGSRTATGNIAFQTYSGGWGERMRLSAAGNLLVGKSSTGDYVTGIEMQPAGAILSYRTSGVASIFGRTDAGEITRFTLGTSIIGRIGSYSSDRLFIGAGDTNITFKPSHDIFYPSTSTGAARDNAIDLGDSGARFKDLYLSGTMIGNILKLRQQAGSMYVSPTNANTLNASYDENGDTADMWINYRGYQDGFSRFRDFRVGNGKGAVLIFVDGSAASVAITGSLSVSGSFSKPSGSFKIDHPLPAKTETHHLVHSFIEAPQADNIYRGKIDLVDGSATVNIDTAAGMTEGTYVLLNTNTQCFTSNESGWTAVKGSVSGNILTITAQDNTCTETISWMVVGERHDQHMIDTEWTDDNGKVIVEPLKELLENN